MILEVCVDTLAGLEAAVAGGADRIELCSALALGGLTPSAGVMARAAACGVPVMAMVRPRAGDFVWSEAEVSAMEADIAAVRQTGLAGVVLGALRSDGQLDGQVLARLVRAARGMDLTLHRCFDLVPDRGVALDVAVALGFRRILTSGGGVRVDADRIGELVGQAAGRIAIMPGAGVTAKNAALLRGLGADELHGSCSVPVAVAGQGVAGQGVNLGFGPAVERRTDAATVRAVKRAMEAKG